MKSSGRPCCQLSGLPTRPMVTCAFHTEFEFRFIEKSLSPHGWLEILLIGIKLSISETQINDIWVSYKMTDQMLIQTQWPMVNIWLFLTPTYMVIQVNCLRSQQQLNGGLNVSITESSRRLNVFRDQPVKYLQKNWHNTYRICFKTSQKWKKALKAEKKYDQPWVSNHWIWMMGTSGLIMLFYYCLVFSFYLIF